MQQARSTDRSPDKRRRITAALVFMLISALLCGCASREGGSQPTQYSAADREGSAVGFASPPERVVVLQASLADLWLTAGGSVVGVTEDTPEHCPDTAGVQLVGTTKHPSLETIIALEPELVIYSPDIAGQSETALALTQIQIPVFGAKVDSFDDYLYYLEQFTNLTGETLRYQTFGVEVDREIESIIDAVPKEQEPSVLFLRAYSSGVKAKAREHVVCDILNDLGALNIADAHSSLLEELSMEVIVSEDPQDILIVFMGESNQETREMLESTLFSQPAWQELTAVKEGRVFYLPQELFHYKPNARWAQAYQYIYDILYDTLE